MMMPQTSLRVLLRVLVPLVAMTGAAGAQDLRGERLFRQRCASCHALQDGQNRIGPTLAGVVGRTAGQVAGARYSAALRDAGVIWDDATLDGFLANPRRFAPGTTMTIAVPDAEDRRAIIAFLKANP